MNKRDMLEEKGYYPGNIERWLACKHESFREGYISSSIVSHDDDINGVSIISKGIVCSECKIPKELWDEINVKEIKIPICEFGKKLDLKSIIEKVEYVKGDKNDIGDSPDDYVRIVIKDE